MSQTTTPRLVVLTALIGLAFGAQAASLQEAADLLSAAKLNRVEFSGTGHWFQFGQAPNIKLPWPQFNVSKYVASIDYEHSAARVQIVRQQAVDPKRARPAPVTQWQDQYVSGQYAWNLPPASQPQTAAAQPAALEERQAEIIASPQGFIKAALANNATSRKLKDKIEISFTVNGKYRYEGVINAQNEVEQIRTWIDNPVLGDTLVETELSKYQDFNGLRFPTEIIRQQGGQPVLAIRVNEVKENPAFTIAVPEEIQKAPPVAPLVKSDEIAPGVFYLTGGTHHSVAIEQKDHVVLVEAPLNEARSLALIEKVREIIPNKPIRYVVNSHVHFDHSGGLRTFVNEGATIVTQKQNLPFYKKTFSAAHKLNPDQLAASNKAPKLLGFDSKHVLEGGHRIEIHNIAGSGHNDGFALVYLPAEKILIEADAYTPLAAGTPAPASPNPYNVNLYENVQRLKLDVDKIAPLHGRLSSLDELRTVIGANKLSSSN